MAHNLSYNEKTGKYSFFSVQEKAWHSLGLVVQDYPTSAEAIQFAGLDYEVAKTPLFTKAKPGKGQAKEIKVPDFFATVRTDTHQALGVVGKDYQVVQNRDAFAFFDSIVNGEEGLPAGQSGIMYETAGALGNGERIFITAKLPGYIRVGKEDLIEQYLFLTTSHDGSGSITAAFTPVRIVCANTLNAALRNKSNTMRIRHTSGAKERLEQAHKLMGISSKLATEMEAIFNSWTKVKITDLEVRKLIQMALAPNRETLDKLHKGKEDKLSTVYKNACEEAFAYAMMSDTQQMDTTRGTLFGAYNAVTGYFQNVRNYKDEEAKLKSQLLGGTAQLRGQRAFDLCTEFAQNGADTLLLN
jgi:phage/plasmid-like protein (TIGR03299 family)